MRHVLFAAAAIACALPAAASAQSSPSFPEELDGDIARSLPHPYDVEEAGDKLERAVGALLDVPVGGVVQAIDPHARVRRDETLGDVAGRDDPEFEGRMQDDVHGMTLKAADMMRQLAVAAPALRRSLADFERNLHSALDGRGPDYRDDRRR
jgi:hypothetical protein